MNGECGTNLPSPTSSFVGREGEVGELVELCSQRRMVTVAGIGGIGKTRLAIEVARSCRGSFDDGVFLVDLVGVSESDAVGRRFLSVLGIAERPDQPAVETLAELLGDASQLFVVDNCEHVIAGVADVLGRLLPACPGVHVLATSRVRVGVDGEELWELAGLDAADAAQLFADRAHSVNRDFSLTTADQEAVAGVCRALDGIPLAIELAAARTRIMTISEITDHLTDRFTFLSSARNTGPDRHRTLRSMIDWSYDLLTESDQQLFRLLGVYRGGFNLDAVEAMCEGPDREAADAVERLVDASLVTVDTTGPTTRYRLLETVREYAIERLDENGETSEARNRHLDHYASLGEAAHRGMGHGFNEAPVTSEEDRFWIAAMGLDLANLRHALDWALEVGDLDDALTVATPLGDLPHDRRAVHRSDRDTRFGARPRRLSDHASVVRVIVSPCPVSCEQRRRPGGGCRRPGRASRSATRPWGRVPHALGRASTAGRDPRRHHRGACPPRGGACGR